MPSLSLVQVDIGPIPASSAKAWIDYARAVLEGYGLGDEPLDDQVGVEVIASFRNYLDQWARVAKRGGVTSAHARVLDVGLRNAPATRGRRGPIRIADRGQVRRRESDEEADGSIGGVAVRV